VLTGRNAQVAQNRKIFQMDWKKQSSYKTSQTLSSQVKLGRLLYLQSQSGFWWSYLASGGVRGGVGGSIQRVKH